MTKITWSSAGVDSSEAMNCGSKGIRPIEGNMFRGMYA